jgi:aminopeptidase N/puromycin-sensitive aminopeptidase
MSTPWRIRLYITVQHGDSTLFDALQKIYETSAVPEMQEGALRMMAEFSNPALLKRALDYALSGKVRNQDSLIQFATALNNGETRALTWQYIQDNWEKLQKEVTPEMGNALVGSTGGFCTAQERDSVEGFFKAHPVPATAASLRHALESINGCIAFRAQQEENLKKWIAAQPQ